MDGAIELPCAAETYRREAGTVVQSDDSRQGVNDVVLLVIFRSDGITCYNSWDTNDSSCHTFAINYL